MNRSAVLLLLTLMSFTLAGCIASRSSTKGGQADDAKATTNASAHASANANTASNVSSAPKTGRGAAATTDTAPAGKSDNTASANPAVRGNPGRQTTLLMHPLDALDLGYSVRWATSIAVNPKEKLAYVAVLDDLIVTVEHPANVISGISLKTGKLMWRTAIGLSVDVTFMPVRIDDKIFVNTETHLYTLSAEDGKYMARSDLRSPVRNGPAVVGEFVVFGGSDGMVFGHDTRVGYEKWSYNLQAQILVPPVAVASQVFVGTTTGRYAAFSGREGEGLWQGRAFGKISSTPAVSNLGIFLASEDGNLYSLNRSSGEDRWIYRYKGAFHESPIALKNAVYQALSKDELLALQGTNGDEIWTLKTTGRPVAHTSRGLIFVDAGKLEIRDPASSKLITAAPTKKLQEVIPVGASTLILIASDGRLMRLDVD